MVTKRDNRPTTTTDRVNIEQSASGRWAGRVLQLPALIVTLSIYTYMLCINLTISGFFVYA